MSHKITGPENYLVRKLARDCHKTKKRIWRQISDKLMKSRALRIEANLYRINNNTKKDEVIVVPGKVLGIGELDHKLTIACLHYSLSAKKKIESSGSKLLSIEELLKQNPKGTNVKIFY